MALQQFKVYEIVEHAVNKRVDIPEFQRPFVWSPEQVKHLAESLCWDYPVGTLLLWDSRHYQESRAALGTQTSLWIIDGQQRTTALCLLFGMKPFWWEVADWNKAFERYDVMANVLPGEGADRVEFALRNPVRERDPRWVSVREVLQHKDPSALTMLAEEKATQLASDLNTYKEVFRKVHANLQQVWRIRERDIPVITINHDVEDVAEIFARLNQAGTRVREADVILALAAVQNRGWVREEYIPFSRDLADRGWELDAGVYIRTMTGIAAGRARIADVPRDLWSAQQLPTVWKATAQTISEVILRLCQMGLTSSELLPSLNSLIPLFVLHYRWKDDPKYRFERAFRWFLLANRDGRYSASPVTSLNEDVRAVTEAQSFEAALEALYQRLRVSEEFRPEEFLEHYSRAGSRFYRLILYLVLYHHEARDWVDKTRLGYDRTGSSVIAGFQPQWHHIFPSKVLRDAGKSDDDINVLANITVMNEGTNVRRLSAKAPWRYILEYAISPDDLRLHLIPAPFAEATVPPTCQEQWHPRNYEAFVLARAELLAQASNLYLNSLK